MEVLTENDTVFVKLKDKLVFINIKDIRLIESLGNYSKIYFNNNSATVLKSLNYLEERLDNIVFFRANKQYIINIKLVNKIEIEKGGVFAYMCRGGKIPISRRQFVKLRKF